MHKFILVASLLTALAPVLATKADASARSFFEPTVGGDRLSFCITDGAACGKPIADAWCRAIGYDQALNFQRDRSLTSRPQVTRYADTGGICSGATCESFRAIKCWRNI